MIKWNYVKDKKPKKNRTYLVATGYKKATYGYYNGEWYEENIGGESGELWRKADVYAWAELPDAPKRDTI
jgi:hypothetical protein